MLLPHNVLLIDLHHTCLQVTSMLADLADVRGATSLDKLVAAAAVLQKSFGDVAHVR